MGGRKGPTEGLLLQHVEPPKTARCIRAHVAGWPPRVWLFILGCGWGVAGSSGAVWLVEVGVFARHSHDPSKKFNPVFVIKDFFLFPFSSRSKATHIHILSGPIPSNPIDIN